MNNCLANGCACFVHLFYRVCVLCTSTLFEFADSMSTLDTALPITRLSPVCGVESDDFGYSVVAHKLNASAKGFTDALNSTM